MKSKHLKPLFLIVSILFSVICFSQEEVTDSKYFQSDIVSKIKNPSSNLNLYYPDFLVTVDNYDLWSEINYSNYGEINEPFISWWDDRGTVLLDSTTFYYAIKADTVIMNEEVFTDNIEQKTVKIIPVREKENTSFKLSVAVEETITQFLPLEEYYKDDTEEKESRFRSLERSISIQSRQRFWRAYVPYSQ